jgi:benzodiazapine receptor
MKNWKKLLLCMLIPLAIGAISGFATMASIRGWFNLLNKPSFNPPNYIFGPVWTTLYLLMGISSYLIAKKEQLKGYIRAIYFTQLALNFLWSFIFFKFHLIGWALIDIIILWCFILMMIVSFYKINKTSGLLQLFYLLWVSFATLLNAAIFYLN